MSEHDRPHELLRPAPLGDEVRLDDPTEDRARANTTIADVVAEDLASEHTPSRWLRDGEGAGGFEVPTEPLFDDDDPRGVEDVELP